MKALLEFKQECLLEVTTAMWDQGIKDRRKR